MTRSVERSWHMGLPKEASSCANGPPWHVTGHLVLLPEPRLFHTITRPSRSKFDRPKHTQIVMRFLCHWLWDIVSMFGNIHTYPHHLIQVLNAATNGARGSIATNVPYTLEQQWRRLLSSLVPCVAQGICFPQFRSPHKESCAVTISDIFTTRFRRSIHLERLECWVFIVQQSSK